MKRIIAIFLVFLFLLSAFSLAGKNNAAPQNEWNKKFVTSYEFTDFHALISVSDGYVMVGSTLDYPENARVIVVKADRDGNLIWDKTLDGRIYNWGESITTADDGGFVIGGGSESGIIFAVKMDDNGNIVWNYSYGSGFLRSICKAKNGYLFGGETTDLD